jgi:hypothetical protein
MVSAWLLVQNAKDELTFKPLNLISIFSHRGWLHCQTKSEIDTEVHKIQTTGAELGVKDDTSGKFECVFARCEQPNKLISGYGGSLFCRMMCSFSQNCGRL